MYLVILVASVFLGTQVFAVPTPVAQLTLYRLCALSVIPVLSIQLWQRRHSLKWLARSQASFMVGALLVWWLWALASVAWVQDIKLWFQTMFLMTLGVSSVLALYFWVDNLYQWRRLVNAVWVVMSGLMAWGYFEIVTGRYFFADVVKLSREQGMSAGVWRRIPITTFANQNDYAVMLLAYIVTSLILYHLSITAVRRLVFLFCVALASYLIYRTGSRMALLCTLLLLLSIVLQQLNWRMTRKHFWTGVACVVAGALLVFFIRPSLVNRIISLFYSVSHTILTGDIIRVNMMRNGLVFLAETGGFGVGAGNIEHWMKQYAFLPTRGIPNIHNWWFEILVGYGVIVFALYTVGYGGLIYRLGQLKRHVNKALGQVVRLLWSFLIIYVLASITSANNMLIEWHWIYFGLIISFVKLQEQQREWSVQ